MFHKILVAVDTSKINKYVFEKALALAKLTGAQLNILHVLSPDENECPDLTEHLRTYYSSSEGFDKAEECSQKLWKDFSEHCLRTVQSQADEAKAAGVHAECCQVSGSPGLTICTEAKRWEVDLIVIGRRRYLSKVEELLLGSTSNYVLHHAPCNVLVVTRCF